MSVEERIADCAKALDAWMAINPLAAAQGLDELMRSWDATQRGKPVFVADSGDFYGQFGDDRRGAYDMEDRMNECAAHERDAMLGRVRSALSAAPSTDLPTIRLAAALATVRAVRLGPYDERAVAGALWELGRALARAAVPRAGGART